MGSIVTETTYDTQLDQNHLAGPIVHVVGAGEFGGAEAQILALLTELQRRRVNLVVVTYYEGTFAQRIRAIGIPLYTLRTRTPWGDFYQLLTICRTVRAGLLHTHGVRASLAGRFAGRLASVPVVTTVHSDLYYDYASPVKRIVFMRFEAMTRRLSLRVVAVSEALSRTLLERGYRRERLVVIRNALDVTAADAEIARVRETPLHLRRQLGVPDRAYVVICVARLHAVKRQDVLIEATAVLPAVNDRPVHLVLVGDGTEATGLKRLAQDGPSADRVHFLGARGDVFALLAEADVFVLPSQMEGLPIAPLEAMLSGLPVIASRVGGLPEIVVEGESGTGALVAPGDVHAVAQALHSILAEDDRRIAMGKRAEQRVRSHFALAHMVDITVELYENTEKAAEKM